MRESTKQHPLLSESVSTPPFCFRCLLLLKTKKKKNSGFQVPKFVNWTTRIRTKYPKKLLVQVLQPKILNISVRILELSSRVSGFRLGIWFWIFLNTPLYYHEMRVYRTHSFNSPCVPACVSCFHSPTRFLYKQYLSLHP